MQQDIHPGHWKNLGIREIDFRENIDLGTLIVPAQLRHCGYVQQIAHFGYSIFDLLTPSMSHNSATLFFKKIAAIGWRLHARQDILLSFLKMLVFVEINEGVPTALPVKVVVDLSCIVSNLAF